MTFKLMALAVDVPQASTHQNLLGTVASQTYKHLFDEAGAFSRPSTVRRGITRMHTDSYQAPALPAETRNSTHASQLVGQLAQALPKAMAQVGTILHTQCTLDQQILGSTCLRLQQEHARQAHLTQTIGQNGTAGIGMALQLARVLSQSSDGASDELMLISASDKWMAPFYRRVPDVVTYGDAAAACLIQAAPASTGLQDGALAVIEDIVWSEAPLHEEPWAEPAEVVQARLVEWAASQVHSLMAALPEAQRGQAILMGDAYSRALSEQVAQQSGWSGELRLASDAGRSTGVHLSSASPLVALADLMEVATQRGHDIDAVIWTASLSGHAAAMRVRCSANARRIPQGWVSVGLADNAPYCQ